MFSRVLFITASTFLLTGLGSSLVPLAARADTVLTQAVLQTLRKQVTLHKNRTNRPARVYDRLQPNDALSTGQSAMAELKFNEGSLARLGERSIFRFSPNSRSASLNGGTVLMLIKPGQGTTRVKTPNAAAGIRGSALFIRYNEETKTTLIGALTNSRIEVSNSSGTQSQELKAGDLAVVVRDRIEQVYQFDLRLFYETSPLVEGLDLEGKSGTVSPDEAIAQVQQETVAALQAQDRLSGQGVVDNPGFVSLGAGRSDAAFPPNNPDQDFRNTPVPGGAPTDVKRDPRDRPEPKVETTPTLPQQPPQPPPPPPQSSPGVTQPSPSQPPPSEVVPPASQVSPPAVTLPPSLPTPQPPPSTIAPPTSQPTPPAASPPASTPPPIVPPQQPGTPVTPPPQATTPPPPVSTPQPPPVPAPNPPAAIPATPANPSGPGPAVPAIPATPPAAAPVVPAAPPPAAAPPQASTPTPIPSPGPISVAPTPAPAPAPAPAPVPAPAPAPAPAQPAPPPAAPPQMSQ